MDIRKTLLQQHSKQNAVKVALYVGNSCERFKHLVSIYLAGPYRVTQCASWPLSICVEKSPELIGPHLNSVLKHLERPDIHDAVKRNTIRLLQFVDIPPRFQGKVIDLCFRYLQNNNEPVAVKVFSMTVLSRLVKLHPGLRRELKIILEDQLPYASAGFISRAGKILKELELQAEY
jgi:hypothetical protein